MKKIYTLTVIDRTGDIVGKSGAIIVPSKEILLRDDADSIFELRMNEAIEASKVSEIPSNYNSSLPYYLFAHVPDDKRAFVLWFCAKEPNQNTVKRDEAIKVWQRVG